MKKRDILPAWGRILRGQKPFLSLEITKECPLRCPGCYAYDPQHLGGATTLRQLSDLRGGDLVEGALALVRRHRPLHVSIVGGEPLVRYRELDDLLPKLLAMGTEVQLVTSAVRPIPRAWASLSNLHLVVSIDGLQPEHDKRRSPATYERILTNISGHSIIVHCTVTRQMAVRAAYLREFCSFWSGRAEVRKIWFSLYTPQQGDDRDERLAPEDRLQAVRDIAGLRASFPKLQAPDIVLHGYERPPQSPEECIFAQITTCVSADMSSPVMPCQIGGQPVCAECGCVASAAMAAIGNYRIAGLLKVSDIFALSKGIGERRNRREKGSAAAVCPEASAGD